MKKVKEVIVDADPRLKGLLIMMIAYMAVMFTVINTQAANKIENYQQTYDIQVIDGNEQAKEYLVKEEKVKTVLSDLDIKLNSQDTVNKDLNDVIKDKDLIQITRVNEEEVVVKETLSSQTVSSNNGKHLFTTETTQQGQTGEVNNTYKIVYANGKEVSRTLTNSQVIKPAVDTVVSTGSVQPGAYFTGRLTTYGGDCAGGNGTSSVGISLSPTTGVQGSNSAKLRYNGSSYYCLAADPSIPFGTIIKITNHNLGVESEAYGIVVDRGGAIKGAHIDIFNGTERGKYFSGGGSKNTNFEIISVGSGKNFWK